MSIRPCCWSTIFDSSKTLVEAFFAIIPYQWHTNNEIANYEGYYASVFYSYFASLGLTITVEDSSQAGCFLMAILFNGNAYVFHVSRWWNGCRLWQRSSRYIRRTTQPNIADEASRFT